MSITDLKKETSRKSKVTSRAISYRAQAIKLNYGPFSDEVAYGIVAQQAGVEVTRFITDPYILAEIRNQIDRINLSESESQKQKTINQKQ